MDQLALHALRDLAELTRNVQAYRVKGEAISASISRIVDLIESGDAGRDELAVLGRRISDMRASGRPGIEYWRELLREASTAVPTPTDSPATGSGLNEA